VEFVVPFAQKRRAGWRSFRAASKMILDHDDFGLKQSKIINLIDSKSLERDAGGKPVSTFPHPALANPVHRAAAFARLRSCQKA
jgi:hypothetical protein